MCVCICHSNKALRLDRRVLENRFEFTLDSMKCLTHKHYGLPCTSSSDRRASEPVCHESPCDSLVPRKAKVWTARLVVTATRRACDMRSSPAAAIAVRSQPPMVFLSLSCATGRGRVAPRSRKILWPPTGVLSLRRQDAAISNESKGSCATTLARLSYGRAGRAFFAL